MPSDLGLASVERTGRFSLVISLLILGMAAGVSTSGCSTIKTRLAMNEGISHYKSKEYEKALASFKRAIAVDPKYAEAHLDLGMTYMELYEPGSEHAKDKEYADGAIQAFKSYLELDPTNEKAQGYLVNVCKLSGRLPDVIDFFMVDYTKDPRDLKTVKTIASLYHMAGDTENAIQWFEKAAQLEPDNAEAWYSVGVACWGRSYNSQTLDYESRMALLDKGLAALEKAQSIKKDYFEAITYESLIYRQKAQYDISPAGAVTWRQKADDLLAKAMELRNAAMAAQAAAAAAAQSGTPSTTPGKTGGQ